MLIPSLIQKSTTEMNTFMNNMHDRDLSQKRSATHSKSTYHKDPRKNRAESAARSKKAITKI